MRYFLLLLVLISVNWLNSHACTTAIVSGKFTVDGRPLLFKHRDTGFTQNKLMYFKDGKYDYIGTVNSADKEGNEIWAGFNSAGFAIMNSEAYNLNVGDTYIEQGVDVEDNHDFNDPIITGTVDTSTAGTYTIVYTVTDLTGNSTVVTRDIIVS